MWWCKVCVRLFLSLVDIEFIWWKRELFMRKFEMKCVCVYLYIINDSWKSRVSHTNSNVPFYFVSFQFIQDDSCIRILQKITQTRKFKTKIIKKRTNTFMLKLWHDSHFFSLSPIFSVFPLKEAWYGIQNCMKQLYQKQLAVAS